MRALAHVLLMLALAPFGVGATPTTTLAQAPASPASTATEATGMPTTAPGVVNVNTATLEELTRLPGVGPAKAQAILEARARRPFRRLGDLRRVSGFGRKTIERLAPMIAFEGPTTLAARRR